MKHVYVIHGYTASPDKHWFRWLEQQLAAHQITCHCLAMPESDSPDPTKWLDYLHQQVNTDQPTVFVGHSLGCIATLNWLVSTQKKIAGAVFVSGFYQALTTLPELTPFAELYQNLIANQPLPPLKSYVVSARDDQIVPYHYSDALAQHLAADYICYHQGGHFLDREGWVAFPLVLELVEKLFLNLTACENQNAY